MKLYKIIATLASSLVLFSALLLPVANAQSVLDNNFDNLRYISNSYGQADLRNADTRSILVERVGAIVQAFLALLALVMVIYIIYAGYLWLTSRGNEQQTEEAYHTIRSAIIGAIVIISAWVITGFIIFSVSQAVITH